MIKDIHINLFLFLACLLDIFLAFFIVRNSHKKEHQIVFAFSSLFVGLWTFGILMFRLTTDLRMALFWNREFIVASGLIASTFLHFSLVFTGSRLSNAKRFFLHLPNAFIVIAVFIPNFLIRNVVVRSWGKESLLGYFYPLFALYFSLYIILSYSNP